MAAILTKLSLHIQAGTANPAPPIGTALGPHGINIVDFCKEYNEKTSDQKGQIIPAEITIYEDRTFSFILKTPPVSDLIKKAANLKKGSSDPKREIVGSINNNQVKEIAEIKLPDLNAYTVEQAMEIVKGTARSMGIEVK
ncbi:MAG: 50S ribosomal protein L11 [Chloroflexi bacterium]|nr:50S ribosomal protein L11 [Chloroflexota bacterium]|tara:strand:- start:1331 stop:1750 length:420 start_codon:yes stop_codon:yes gene_type:complete